MDDVDMGDSSPAPAAFSLARSSGRLTSLAVSFSICVAHVLFFYAQLSGMESDCPGTRTNNTYCPEGLPDDGLVEIALRGELMYEANGELASTLSMVEDQICGTACPGASDSPTPACSALSCDECASIGPLGFHQRCNVAAESVVMHLSYTYMVSELYTRDQNPNCYLGTEPWCTGVRPGVPAAAILVGASFIWPHVKLLLLHLFFYVRLSAPTRRNLNYWLAFFGKWTLTDVLVWCACIGVFHGLAIHESALHLWHQVENDTLALCTSLCHNSTHAPPPYAPGMPPSSSSCSELCAGLDAAIDKLFLNPSELPSSKLNVFLAFRTRVGTYFFCLAVVLSLSVSVVVDLLEDRSLEQPHPKRRGRATLFLPAAPAAAATLTLPADGGSRADGHRALLLTNASCQSGAPSSRGATSTSALSQGGSGDGGGRCTARRAHACVHILAVTVQLCLTTGAVTLPLFRRHVDGGIPALLRSRGFDFDGSYSAIALAKLASAPGGWDYLLSATFWIFIVVCPLLRGATLLALLTMPLRRRTARFVHTLSRSLSYYYAHEVFIVGVPLLQITVHPLTSTLFTEQTQPLCRTADRLFHYDSCFSINIIPTVGYTCVCASFGVFLLTGFDGSPTHKFVHKQLYPADEPPPTLRLPRCVRRRERGRARRP